MKVLNFYKIGLVAMVLINVALIIILARGPQHPDGKPGGDLRQKISKTLDLDENQKTEYFALADNHREIMNTLDERHKELSMQYFSALKTDNPSQNQDNILAEITEIESEKLAATFDHFKALKLLCSPAQAEKFDSLIPDIMNVLLGPDRKPNHPGGSGERPIMPKNR